MADILPPAPINEAPSSYGWVDWYFKLRTIVNESNNISWASINKTGSNLNELTTRLHNDLQSIQGGAIGDYQHLTTAQVGNIGILQMTSQAGDPTTSDIAASTAKLYKNTTSSLVKLWVNDGGTLKSVTLL